MRGAGSGLQVGRQQPLKYPYMHSLNALYFQNPGPRCSFNKPRPGLVNSYKNTLLLAAGSPGYTYRDQALLLC